MRNDLNYYDGKYDVQKFEWGEVVWLHEPTNLLTERLSAGLVKFFPGKSQYSHIHFGEEQILYVLSGEGIHMVNGEEKHIKEGMLMHSPPYSEHEVINTGKDNLVFLITYTPSKLMEVHPDVSIANDKHILEVLEKEVLENIQREVAEILQLSVIIVDNDNNYVTEPINTNKFCDLCKRMNVCQEKNRKYEGGLKELDKAFACCSNIITIMIPILVNNRIFGYIKCGYFLLNRSEDMERIISEKFGGQNLNVEELIAAYNEIPVIPKSRLYAVRESLGIVSKLISQIIENNLVEKELSKKNNEILKNAQEKIYLEDALKQANMKLLKAQVSSSLKSYNFKDKIISNREHVEYPIEYENKLKDSIKKLDDALCIKIIKEVIKVYKEKGFSVQEVKGIFEELIVTLSRLVYEETKDSKMFLDMRYRYKNRISNCTDYTILQETIIEFSQESISILNSMLLSGRYDLINKINLYIENNFHQNLTLSHLAEIFFISPNYLSTLFNEKNAMSLKDYINKLRIKKAKQYLEETDMKISEISKLVGYSQLSYFGSIFNKLEGCTPNEFRRKSKKSKG
ncbi:PocR ligand-binding domain-containing protein [Clostridium magnum]|uniref:Bifunctional transcriptional activator/DNA repair enzyme AdaA n=1 Tax=Clostridium magnum DSM 2767 TaxID=1121326 RepID=A0A161X9Y0_9CLOT|nr:PocR ligand-binding domain-containing protein [Clostridium magnum]KZL91056.1 bifunctional transcriptional activator/DNA repair enzyme AdaA [Clostridium magnum DSM 2767]SHJ56440.1 transcriptional regulator, AraC family [Clostridium magnum DSM 2767]